MSPQQMEKQKRKKKGEQKLEFSPEKVFDVTPAEDVQIDTEASQYKAAKGQGGDRRA